MAKPLKFHQTLNLPPRSAKHGQHRRSSPPSHRHPIVRTDHGSGGSSSRSWFTGWEPLVFPEPEPPAVPYAGIRTGELIGYRLWWVIPEAGEQWLCSLAHRQLWNPGETISGDLSKIVSHSFLWAIWGGVYAFDRCEHIARDWLHMQQQVNGLAQFRGVPGSVIIGEWVPAFETGTFVSGTVKMWGDVVEHEFGYRAEFAKLNSIDVMHGPGDIEALRERYGVGRTLREKT